MATARNTEFQFYYSDWEIIHIFHVTLVSLCVTNIYKFCALVTEAVAISVFVQVPWSSGAWMIGSQLPLG